MPRFNKQEIVVRVVGTKRIKAKHGYDFNGYEMNEPARTESKYAAFNIAGEKIGTAGRVGSLFKIYDGGRCLGSVRLSEKEIEELIKE
jgi:hypothetical protein